MALLQKLGWKLDGGPWSNCWAVCIKECQPNRPRYIPNPERIASLSPALDRRGRKGAAVLRWENTGVSPSTLKAEKRTPNIEHPTSNTKWRRWRQGHPKPHQCDIKATSKRVDSQPIATPKPP